VKNRGYESGVLWGWGQRGRVVTLRGRSDGLAFALVIGAAYRVADRKFRYSGVSVPCW